MFSRELKLEITIGRIVMLIFLGEGRDNLLGMQKISAESCCCMLDFLLLLLGLF